MVKTLPLKQWDVARELRRRIKLRFDRERIEIPFPHQTVQWEGAPPAPAAVASGPRDGGQSEEAMTASSRRCRTAHP